MISLRKRKGLFAYIFITAIILVSIFVLSSSWLHFKTKPNGMEQRYKFVKVNLEKKEYSTGNFDSSNIKQLSIDDGFIVLRDGAELSMISKLELEEYACFGTCYCDNERRNSISVVSKGVTVLVASLASIYVVSKAKDYVQKECENQMFYDGGCEKANIKSEVTACSTIEDSLANSLAELKKIEEKKKKEMEIAEEKNEESGRDMRLFNCKGHCMERYFKDNDLYTKAHKMGCDTMKAEGDVNVDCTDISYRNCFINARKEFQNIYLKQFCRDSSSSKELMNLKKSGKQWKTIDFCVGSIKDENYSIECVSETPF